MGRRWKEEEEGEGEGEEEEGSGNEDLSILCKTGRKLR